MRKKRRSSLAYWENRAVNKALDLKPFWGFISGESIRNNLNPDLLLGLLAIEDLNRGGLYRLVENVLVRIFPEFVLKRDFSLGLAQMKPRTIERELGLEVSGRNLSRLMQSTFSIAVSARLLGKYCKQIGFNSKLFNDKIYEEKLRLIVRKYTTGSFALLVYPWTDYYSKILKHLCHRGFLSVRVCRS